MTQPELSIHDHDADRWIADLTVQLVLRLVGDGATRVDAADEREALVRTAHDIARRTYLHTRVPIELHDEEAA